MDRGCTHADCSLWFSCMYAQRKALCHRYVTCFIARNREHCSLFNKIKHWMLHLMFSQVDGMPRRRTQIRWSVTILKPTSGPCAPRWKSGATGPVLLWWMERSMSSEEKKAGTGERLKLRNIVVWSLELSGHATWGMLNLQLFNPDGCYLAGIMTLSRGTVTRRTCGRLSGRCPRVAAGSAACLSSWGRIFTWPAVMGRRMTIERGRLAEGICPGFYSHPHWEMVNHTAQSCGEQQTEKWCLESARHCLSCRQSADHNRWLLENWVSLIVVAKEALYTSLKWLTDWLTTQWAI